MSEQQNILKIHRLPFTQVPNELICSNKISGMAKALWCVFYSKPDNWTFFWREIENNFKEGRDAVRNAAKQLEELGYLKKNQKKINSGKGMVFGGMEIELFPYPNQQTQDSTSNTENPYPRNPDTRDSNTRKAVTYKERKNKDLLNKDLNNSFFSNAKTASKTDLENYGKEKKYLSDFKDFWIKNEAKGWKGIENRYAQYDGWELEHKKKFPEKHKTTLNSANSESTLALKELAKEINEKAASIKFQLTKAKVNHAWQYFENLQKTETGFVITGINPKAENYREILQKLNVELKIKMIFLKKKKEILNHQDFLINEKAIQKKKLEPETFSEYLDDQILKIKE